MSALTKNAELGNGQTDSRSRALKWIGILVGIGILIYLPSVLSVQWMGIAVQALLLALATLALTLLAGYTGQFSIASAGLLAVGAAVLAAISLQLGAPILIGLLGATAAGALVGLIVGLPSLRLKGLYLLLATLAAHFILLYFFRRYVSAAFGPIGIIYQPLELFGITFNNDRNWYFLLLPLVGVTMWYVSNVRKSGVGRSLLAIKQNEVASAASGIDVGRLKLSAFIISSALTAFVGALYGLYFQSIASDYFTLQTAINLYVALIVGGQLAAGGAVIGGLFVAAGPTFVANLSKSTNIGWLTDHSGELTNFLFGVAIIVVLMARPGGIWSFVESLKAGLEKLGSRVGTAPERDASS